MINRLTFTGSSILLFLFLFATSIFSQTPISPTDGATVTGPNVTITWTAFDDGSGNGPYDFEIDTDAAFGAPTQSYGIATTSYNLSGAYSTTYHWRVRDTDTDGSGADGAWHTYSFSTYPLQLGIPTLNAPLDKATLVSTNPTFSWSQNADASSIFNDDEFYELEVSTDQWFANIAYSNYTIPTAGATTTFDLSSVLFSLNGNTKYYWRVRAYATSTPPTVYSPWSATYNFTTTPATVTPTQTFPIGGNTVYTNTPTFYWYTGVVSDYQFFEIWYGESSSVTVPLNAWATNVDPTLAPTSATGNYVAPATVGKDLNYTLTTPLTSNTDYKWWVRATDGTNFTDWSSMGTFHTSSTNGGPVEPVGTYPTLNEYQYTNNPTLYWYIITQVTGLKFEVFLSSATSAPTDVVSPPTVPGTSSFYDYSTVGTNYFYQLSGLTSSSQYYWWVRSTDGTTYSDWSPMYSFKTTAASGSPVKPVLTYPANGETVYYSDVELHWYATTIATDLKYDLYWGTSSTAPTSGTTPTTSGITDLYTTINGLTANTTYYWWVRSTDNAGANPSDWSDMGSFVASESAAQVKVPTQMYPTGGITVTGTSVDLSWAYNGSMSGIYFEARYSLYPTMLLPTTITISPNTATTQTLSGLAPGTTYYWQVRATNGTLTSAWAGPAEFATWASAEAPLVMPKTGSPVANVVIDTDSPTLSWFLPTQSEGLQYDLQYSTSGDFSNPIEIKNLTTNSVQLNNLKDGQNYFWRVRTNDGSGNVSIYSSIGTFIGKSITSVNTNNIIPEKFNVSQNYPNPFNPSTVITYSLPDAQYVTLRVYNMLGQEVATLVNGEVQAGIYNVTWNGVDNSGMKVATGTYIYRVVAGNNIITKKMLLLK